MQTRVFPARGPYPLKVIAEATGAELVDLCDDREWAREVAAVRQLGKGGRTPQD